jgi:hypothetical protein
MTIGMILDRTVRLYMQNLSLMIGITALSYFPYLVVLVVTMATVGQDQDAVQIAIILGPISMILWVLIAQPLSVGATTYAVGETYLNRQVSTADAIKAIWRRYGVLLPAQMVAGLVVLVGFILFIVPGILWTLSYTLIAPVIMLETVGAQEGRKRSWDLVSGNRGKVFVVLFVVGILTGVLSSAVDMVLPLLFDATTWGGRFSLQVVAQLLSYLVVPITTIANVLLYYDIRIRKEGFDLEMLNSALSQPWR